MFNDENGISSEISNGREILALMWYLLAWEIGEPGKPTTALNGRPLPFNVPTPGGLTRAATTVSYNRGLYTCKIAIQNKQFLVSDIVSHPYKFDPLKPNFYNHDNGKTGVFRGIHYFSFFLFFV